MHGVALLLTAAAAAHLLARRLGLPTIPLLLLVGVVLSRIAPMPAELLQDALVLGVSVLLFLAGLELDPRRMRAQTRGALGVGTVQLAVLAAVGFAAAAALGYDLRRAAYLAVALAASSTLVGVGLLQSRKQMYEPFGRLVLGVLLLQDLVVLGSIPLLTAVGSGRATALIGLPAVAALGALAMLVRARLAPLLLRFTDDPELLLLGTLALLFAFMALGSWLALPIVVGAFLAGVALARFPVNGVVRIELTPVADFFRALFFTAMGAVVQVPTAGQLMEAVALGVLVLLVTVPLVTWLAERAGFTARSAIEAGLLLSQSSELSLVIGLAGVLQGHIDQGTFTIITLVTLGTMLLTPFLATDAVAWRLVRVHPARRRSPEEPVAGGHVLLLGAGSTGMPLLEDLVITGVDIVVVDDDPAVLARLHEAGVRTVRGDAADPVVLRRAGAERARVVISTIRRTRDNQPLLDLGRGVPVLVRVFDAADTEWVRARGGVPVLFSEATVDALLEWYDEAGEELRARVEARRRRMTLLPATD